MRQSIFFSLLFSSCYSVIQNPDYDFINQIKQQAILDSGLTTTIELNPSKISFGRLNEKKILSGFFYITNNGSRNFNLSNLKANCNCIETNFAGKTIAPNDSLKISYQLDPENKKGFISNTIVAIGNCQFGNQTFLIEGTIINN